MDARGDQIELLGAPEPDNARLYVVCVGNVPREDWQADHLAVSDTRLVQDPAQAWNALAVGAYTELSSVPASSGFTGYRPLASRGELSPISRTSMMWSNSWPIKPDIVLEGGNVLMSGDGKSFDTHDCMGVITTAMDEHKLLTSMTGTSPATAQAARLAATVWARYPGLRPESVRALLVHGAEWTPPMRALLDAAPNKTQRARYLRRYGWGVPTERRVLNSADSDVSMIVEDEFQPFELTKTKDIRFRAMRLHELPWPAEKLRELFDTEVRLRVTLSYFIEPNPAGRGWQGRYRYPSHGLRFDVISPYETREQFQARCSNSARRSESGRRETAGSHQDRWYFGPMARTAGSLHGDMWMGTAQELAACRYLAVTPVGGWWKENKRKDRLELPIRYTLIVSLAVQGRADIYTPIAAQIGVPVTIMT